ncbi:MAG: SDR family oxidoreductase [Alphaproteobacteria bacterium]|nr:SDR family oxidoreductase [Alphaproteobacteria bacterium]
MSILDCFRLDGRAALITGAGRGLGWEMAKALAEAGAHVLLNGRAPERLQQRVEELRAAGLSATPLVFDMADRAAMETAVRGRLAAGRIDILINNVGERDRRKLDELSTADFERLVDVDLNAAYALAKLVLPGMIERRAGRIIMVTSIAASLGAPGAASYIAAKGGLAALVRAMASEVGVHGVTCNAIAPGFFHTETNDTLFTSPAGHLWRDRVPMRRFARPEEIAGAALYLASDAASYVNGHTLTVDGGVSATFMMR